MLEVQAFLFFPAGLEVKAGAGVVAGAEVTLTGGTTKTEAIISRGHTVTTTTDTRVVSGRTVGIVVTTTVTETTVRVVVMTTATETTVGVVVTTTVTETTDSTETAHLNGETDTR